MKQLGEFLLGIVLLIVGAIIFLQNIVVNSFSLLYRINNVSVGGILLLLILISFIVLIVKPNWITKSVFGGLWLTFFVCMIISLNVRVRTMSGLEIVLILGTIGTGIAFIIKSVFDSKKENK